MPAARTPSSTAGRPAPASHFPDFERQRMAVTVGMWFFLATEVLLFGGLFLSYTVNRLTWPATFAEAGSHLLLLPGIVNTVLLLTSSLFMTLAVDAAERRSRRLLRVSLVVTLALGCAFLAIKGYEYHHEYSEGLLPVRNSPFTYDGARPQVARLFFGQYLMMTGLHAVHLVVGIAVLGAMTIRVWRLAQPALDAERLRVAGLYWHLVDTIWVFLFPLLYLLGRHA